MKWIVIFVFLGGVSVGQNSILWRITGKGIKDTSYIYGTIHLSNKKFFYVNPLVHEIKKKVKAGVFEIKLQEDSLLYIAKAMIANSGNRVMDLYIQEEQEVIYDYFKRHGITSMMVNTMKPIALTTMLLTFIYPPDTAGAIDQLLQNDFKKMDKPVFALETIRMQSDLLMSMPIDLQKKELWESLANLDSLTNSLRQMDSVYTLQDLKGISTFLDDLEEEEYLNKELLNDSRNLKMVEKLPGIMNKQSVLVCVGAVHLCGEDGIIELLRKKGYHLEPLLEE